MGDRPMTAEPAPTYLCLMSWVWLWVGRVSCRWGGLVCGKGEGQDMYIHIRTCNPRGPQNTAARPCQNWGSRCRSFDPLLSCSCVVGRVRRLVRVLPVSCARGFDPDDKQTNKRTNLGGSRRRPVHRRRRARWPWRWGSRSRWSRPRRTLWVGRWGGSMGCLIV